MDWKTFLAELKDLLAKLLPVPLPLKAAQHLDGCDACECCDATIAAAVQTLACALRCKDACEAPSPPPA